ncbi:hypothetical protein BDV12DRAFT_169673, partial [Aspergillus spectabilis]
MPDDQAPDPNRKEGFMERMLHRRPSYGEAQAQNDHPQGHGLGRQSSNEENPAHAHAESHDEHRPETHHQRRNSRLQRFKDFMHSEEELDEAGKFYAQL